MPEPENWQDRPVLVTLGIVLFGAGTVYSIAQTVTAIQRGHYLAATIAGGFAVFIVAFLLIIGLGRLRASTLRAVWDSRGTTFLSDPMVKPILVVSFAGAALSSTLFVIGIESGHTDIPFNRPGINLDGRYYMTTLSIVSIIGLIALTRRGEAPHLRLTPNGIEYASLAGNRKASWDDITDITDIPAKKLAYRPYRPISFDVKGDKPILLQNGGGWAPNGAALYWMIRHYWLHPENRSELTDGRALERLRNEQFEPE